MAKKKQFNIKDYCEELIGKHVKYQYNFVGSAIYHGRIVRVRLEIDEEETGDMTLRSPKQVELDTGEVELF